MIDELSDVRIAANTTKTGLSKVGKYWSLYEYRYPSKIVPY